MPRSPSTLSVVFKICSDHEWQAAQAAGVYTGSPDDLRDGFMHFSAAHQVPATLERYFAGRADLVLLAVPVSKLGAALKFEPSRGGDLFPHLYGPLPADVIAWQAPLLMSPDGTHKLPAELTTGIKGT